MTKSLLERVRLEYKNRFEEEPLLVHSPGRINLIGEHTDYNGGFVFPAAIDKYIVGAFGKEIGKFSKIYSLDLDEETTLDPTNLKKREKGNWTNYVIGVVRELQKRNKQVQNFNLVIRGNIPMGAGLSSSAALENTIVFGLNELLQFGLTKREMVKISVEAEHNFADVECGFMDQFASMHGKEGHAIFLDCANLSHEYISIEMTDHQFLLINTNVKHELSGSPFNKRKAECNEGLDHLKQFFPDLKSLSETDLDQLEQYRREIPSLIYQRCLFVIQENQRVKTARNLVEDRDWQAFGNLLFDSHHGLQNLFEVSCPELDFLVEKAKDSAFVIGSRMMGGGFGGCTLNLIQTDQVASFSNEIKSRYLREFGNVPDIYSVKLSNGTHVVNL